MYRIFLFSLACLLSILSIVLSIGVGDENIPFFKVIASLFDHKHGPVYQIVWELRAPRTVAAYACGALLAVSGMLLQVLLRNPLADPYIFGLSGGAGTGALIAMMLGLNLIGVNILALCGACFAAALVFGLSFSLKGWDLYRMLLTGIVISAGFGAIVTLILTQASTPEIKGMLFWLVGDLTYARDSLMAWIVLFIVVSFTIFYWESFNVLSLGEESAKLLGMPVLLLQTIIFLFATVTAAAAVLLGGAIGFVGLIIPHALRLIGVNNYQALPALAALFGGAFLTFADTLARTINTPMQFPVGAITALIGVPVLLILLFGTRHRVDS